MTDVISRKKSKGRPALNPLEKQRRLVARLHQHIDDLHLAIDEESRLPHYADHEPQHHLLLSTFQQRMNLAREVAKYELEGDKNAARAARQKLNLFRPQGFTEEDWNALPDSQKRLAPGKPKMPKELEMARMEIECGQELEKLRVLEKEYGEEPSDIGALRTRHGNNQVGRPGKDILGELDRQMHTAFYKRRDLVRLDVADPKPSTGRPRKSYQERFAYFTSIIEDCRNRISEGESALNLVYLQLRYLKRLRDHATRLRLQIKNTLGPALVALKIDLAVVEEQLKVETALFNEYQDNYVTMSSEKIESLRNNVARKIKASDSIAFPPPTQNYAEEKN
ncbi:hypothetical protein ACIOUF_15780 [Pseudomonas iridis]|uniref:Uncharacterized protein n=1 Tax=Pseudomonas iridis TaxID=2710587 RepID=A0ABW8DMA2_9PSED